MSDFIVSKAEPTDIEAVQKICCLTGNNGESINQERWKFFGKLWIDPYFKYYLNTAYICKNQHHETLGYLVGCPNELKFYFKIHRLILLLKIMSFQFKINNDVKKFLKRFFKLEKSPEECFSKKTKLKIHAEYPAHLHINLLPPLRGKGIGHALLELFESDLKNQEIPGIHVFCGPSPLQFYFKEGFEIIEEIKYQGRFSVFCLGKKI